MSKRLMWLSTTRCRKLELRRRCIAYVICRFIEAVFIYTVLVIFQFIVFSEQTNGLVLINILMPSVIYFVGGLLFYLFSWVVLKIQVKDSPNISEDNKTYKFLPSLCLIFGGLYFYLHFIGPSGPMFHDYPLRPIEQNISLKSSMRGIEKNDEPSSTQLEEPYVQEKAKTERVLTTPEPQYDTENKVPFKEDEIKHASRFMRNISKYAIGGNWDEFLLEVKQGGGLQVPPESILTAALMFAVADAAPRHVIEDLLSMGAKLDINNRHMAFHMGDVNHFTTLVTLGVPLNGHDYAGHTPLTSCLSYPLSEKRKDILDYLLRQGVDVNWLDKSGNSPMSYVLNQPYNEHSADIIQTLLHHNAELTASDRATFLQVKVNQPDIFDELTARIPELLDYVE